MGTGLSRLEVARQHGMVMEMAPNIGIEDGIHAARMLFPRVWIDETRCERGIECLTHYRRDYNAKLGQFKPTPVHDWASHAADAYRYLAVSQAKQQQAQRAPIKYPRLSIVLACACSSTLRNCAGSWPSLPSVSRHSRRRYTPKTRLREGPC